jgi:hypothetical protein
MHAGPAGQILSRYPLAALLGQPGIDQVREYFSLVAIKVCDDGAASTPHTAIVVLTERVIVADTRFRTLVFIQAGVKTAGEHIDGIQPATRTGWQKSVPTVGSRSTKNAEACAKFYRGPSIHP